MPETNIQTHREMHVRSYERIVRFVLHHVKEEYPVDPELMPGEPFVEYVAEKIYNKIFEGAAYDFDKQLQLAEKEG